MAVSVVSVQNTEDTKLEIALIRKKTETNRDWKGCARLRNKTKSEEESLTNQLSSALVYLRLLFLFVSVIDRDHNSFFMPEFTCLVVVLCPIYFFFLMLFYWTRLMRVLGGNPTSCRFKFAYRRF